ncbi:hypothetical protein Gpo141_00013688 [Globisporangium polare]
MLLAERKQSWPGRCEMWLDDTKVYHNDDCEATFGSSALSKTKSRSLDDENEIEGIPCNSTLGPSYLD